MRWRREPAAFSASSLLRANDQLRRRRRSRRAKIGDEIADGEVGLVADGRDDGDVRGRNGARQAFIVEGEEVLEGTAAARHHDHVHLAVPIEIAHAGTDLRSRTLTLHLRGIDEHADRLVASAENVQHVLDSSAAR